MRTQEGFFKVVILLLLALSGAIGARAEDLIGNTPWEFVTPAAEYASMARVPAEGAPGGSTDAIRITVVRPSQPFYMIMISLPVANPVPAESILRLHFWARSTTGNPIRAVVEKNGPPYTSVFEASPTLGAVWKEYTYTGNSPAFGPNGLGVRFQAGHQAGIVEIAGIKLENLGLDPTLVTARTMIKPEAINERIRKYRTGEIRVNVRGAKGRPVGNVVVHLEQTRHAFLFGCNIFNLDPANTEDWQLQYRQRFAALLNYATLPFYWGAFEPEQDKPQYARLDAMAEWCLAHGITPKGHPLVWHEVYPNWAPKTPDEAIPLLHQRVSDIITHYRGRIGYWDVLNEANAASAFANGEGAWIKRDGPSSVVQMALGWAREAGHSTPEQPETYIYNDYNTGQSNEELLTQLQQRHHLPDVIGIQSHMHTGVWSPERVWETVDRFGQFGIPIHFTEVTVLSGPSRDNVDQNHPPNDWFTTPEDEAKQADYLERFYSILFSHPAMRAITYWDFSDRNAWQNAPAGLVRKDMSPKPAYDRLLRLIHKDWWTDVTGHTDGNGEYGSRAFYGDYRVTVEDRQGRKVIRQITFPTGSKEKSVLIVLP